MRNQLVTSMEDAQLKSVRPSSALFINIWILEHDTYGLPRLTCPTFTVSDSVEEQLDTRSEKPDEDIEKGEEVELTLSLTYFNPHQKTPLSCTMTKIKLSFL